MSCIRFKIQNKLAKRRATGGLQSKPVRKKLQTRPQCFSDALLEDDVLINDFDLSFSKHQRELGEGLAEKGKYEEAIACFEKSIRVGSDAKGYEQMAQILMELEQHSRALFYAQLAADTDNRWIEAFVTLSRAALNAGLPQKALESMQTARRLIGEDDWKENNEMQKEYGHVYRIVQEEEKRKKDQEEASTAVSADESEHDD